MDRRAVAVALAVTVGLLAIPGPAMAGTVSIAGATRSGDILTVTGGSTYTDQPFITLGTDASGDAPAAVGAQGGDITAAAMATTAAGQVKLRWSVSALPAGTDGSPGVMYGWNFCSGGEDNCFELDLQRFTLNPPGTAPTGTLWRCGDPSCDPSGQTRAQTGGIPITFDPATDTITATLPTLINATPGGLITPVTLDTSGPAFSILGTAEPFTGQYNTGDGVGAVADFTVAAKEVSVAVAAAGLDPAAVTYTMTVSPASSGAYTAGVNVAGKTGDFAVYARACFGANNCAYASQAVTL